MSDPHAAPQTETGHAEQAHEEHITDKTFLKVFVALFIFTALSFITNQVLGHGAVVARRPGTGADDRPRIA